LLFGKEFWDEVINWEALARAGTIAKDDLKLFRYVETAKDAIDAIENWESA
jgi:predicted Rossmann-fold nucleotide-binding protein